MGKNSWTHINTYLEYYQRSMHLHTKYLSSPIHYNNLIHEISKHIQICVHSIWILHTVLLDNFLAVTWYCKLPTDWYKDIPRMPQRQDCLGLLDIELWVDTAVRLEFLSKRKFVGGWGSLLLNFYKVEGRIKGTNDWTHRLTSFCFKLSISVEVQSSGFANNVFTYCISNIRCTKPTAIY